MSFIIVGENLNPITKPAFQKGFTVVVGAYEQKMWITFLDVLYSRAKNS